MCEKPIFVVWCVGTKQPVAAFIHRDSAVRYRENYGPSELFELSTSEDTFRENVTLYEASISLIEGKYSEQTREVDHDWTEGVEDYVDFDRDAIISSSFESLAKARDLVTQAYTKYLEGAME
jgi:hypothetical protein